MRLVALLQAAQDPDRVGNRRLAHVDGLEAALERRVLLDVRAVLVERRRADRAQLAAREHRLQQVAGGDRALGRAGADDRVQLVDEEDDLALARRDLGEDGLEPLLELAAVLGPGDERADVERPDALPLETRRHVARDDPLREALGDRRLPHARLADQHRVVLRAAREDLDRAPDLLVPADHRVELPLLGERGQVAPVLLERLVRALGILRRDPLAAAHLLEGAEQRLARHEAEREEQVLDRDELVAEACRLVEGGVEHAAERGGRLRLRTPARDGRLLREPCLRLTAERGDGGAGALDERARQLLVEQRDGQVVGGQLGVAGPARKLLRARDRLPALDGQLVEVHVSPRGWRAGTCGSRYTTISRRYCWWVERISSRSSRSS